MKISMILKAVIHLVIAPRVVFKSRSADRPIFFSTAMRNALIVLDHIAYHEGGTPYKSAVVPNLSKLKSRWSKNLYSSVAKSIYQSGNREKLVFVNWGYSAVDRLGFLPEELGFDNRYIENDLFGFGREQNRPIVGYLTDRQRPYFDGRGPTDMEQRLNNYRSGEWRNNPDAVAFLDALRSTRMHKYSQFRAAADDIDVTQDDLVIFGQVERDAAWVKNESSVKTNVELIAKALSTVQGFRTVYFKPHPKHKEWPSDKKQIERLFPQVQQIDPSVSFKSLLGNKPSVFVNTSGTGLDSGLAGCKVYTAGLAFYACWGATIDTGPTTDRRVNKLTFEDIIFVICTQCSHYFFRDSFKEATLKDITQAILKDSAPT
jgi:capsular polysaccharide export protein